MPSTSKKQRNFMAAAAHNPAFAKKVGISQKVAKEFNAADKGKKFGVGGDVNYTFGGKGQLNKQRTRGGSVYGYQKDVPDVNINKYAGKKAGGSIRVDLQSVNKKKTDHGNAKLFKEGGKTMANKKLFGGKETFAEEKKEAQALKSGKITEKGFAKGEESEGHKEENSKMLAKKIKSGKMTPTAYAKMESKEPKGMRKGGCTKMCRGGGIETKGKTKGRMV